MTVRERVAVLLMRRGVLKCRDAFKLADELIEIISPKPVCWSKVGRKRKSKST